YALNNPLRYNDPLGLFPSPAYNCPAGASGGKCLNDEQRRILENSKITIDGKDLSGGTLWNNWGEKQQNAFMNITDDLVSRNLISQITSLIGGVGETGMGADADRIFANVDSSLIETLKGTGNFTSVSANWHGDFNFSSFKSTDSMFGNIQLSFDSSCRRVDIDHDIGNIVVDNPFKKIIGAVVHAEEVIMNKMFNTRTDQDLIRMILINNPNIQTITPSPERKYNR
ncbi:MAG: hypothetical protein LBT74_05910, partial [Acidobacteriota bacterium]|nr:hypothetical protein [Acidobacteriota bacterium]